MFRKIVEFSVARRGMIVALFLLFLIGGYAAFRFLNIEAFPDPSPPIVEVDTQLDGLSAEEIERRITIPIETGLAGMPGVEHIRSASIYGLSAVKVFFSYSTDYSKDLQQVLNRLAQLPPLPSGAVPGISADTALSEIYRYELVAPHSYSLIELRALQDWVVQRRLLQVPGVVGVTGWGGKWKQYEVEVDLDKLTAYHLTLPQVVQVLSNSNINVGGRTIRFGEQAANISGLGLIKSVDDIDNTVLSSINGTPILMKDVAHSKIGNLPRLGIAARDSDPDIVMGIVEMRRGEKTLEVLERVTLAIDELNRSAALPAGVQLQPFYDRSELIAVTTHTVVHNVVFGIILLFFIQWLFLGNLRTAIVVSATVPAALFFSAMLMYLLGESANLLSVGAIDFGIIIDATVIMVENIYRHLELRDKRAVHTERAKLQTIVAGSAEVITPIFFSTFVIIAAFVPLFTMQGAEGQLFAPMAKTYGYALAGALLATFTITPALSALLLPKDVKEKEALAMRLIRPLAQRLFLPALRYRIVTLAFGALLLIGTAAMLPRLGMEFLPHLEEGSLWIRVQSHPTISLEAGLPYVSRIRGIIKSFPEVITVISQHGRPDDGSDTCGFNNTEFFVPLLPPEQWPAGVTKEKLTAQIEEKLKLNIPGVTFNFSQNIQDMVEEACAGNVKGQNAVKIFGPDLALLESTANKIKAQLETIPGIEDVGVFTETGQPNLFIEVDRARCARHGLATGDVNAIVQAAIGGQTATNVVEGERYFPLSVRLMPKYRESLDAIKAILVPTPSGALVPLAEVCDIKEKPGASYVYREENTRFIPIKFNVRGRDLGGAVAEAQAKVTHAVRLPSGYTLRWVGEFGELADALSRLKIIMPISILLIVFLLYAAFNSILEVLVILAAIPFAWIGGVLALYITGTTFSVSAAVGFISLLGVAVQDGIIVLSYYKQLRQSGLRREKALVQAREIRLRPVLMTCMSACIGLLPAAISTGIGSETQRPLAVVIVGGMLLTPVLIMLVVPVLISLMPEKRTAVEPVLPISSAEPLHA